MFGEAVIPLKRQDCTLYVQILYVSLYGKEKDKARSKRLAKTPSRISLPRRSWQREGPF